MSILHINQSDALGGASIAALRLHENFCRQNLNSHLLVGKKSLKFDDKITEIIAPKKIYKVLRPFTNRLGLNYIYRLDTFKLKDIDTFRLADVIYLHNLHSDYFNYLALPEILKGKKVIYFLHDMWSFTGHCAYSYDCERWKIGCGKCPYLKEYPSVSRDATEWEWKLKKWLLSQIKMTVVCPSQWLKSCAQQSFLKLHPITHIPYGIDTNQFHPRNQDWCRTLLKIPAQKKVLLVLSSSLTVKRKGSDYLSKIISGLPENLKQDIIVLTFGSTDQSCQSFYGCEAMHLGHLVNDNLKCLAYSAADLFVLPALADNLPLSVQESIACGTPVIAFRTGGLPDMVKPGQTGELVQLGNIDEFTNKVSTLLQEPDRLRQMREQCYLSTQEHFSSTKIIEKHLNLIQNLAKN